MSDYESKMAEYRKLRFKFWWMLAHTVAMVALIVGALWKYGAGEYEASIALIVFAIWAELGSPFRRDN